jgi:glycosyltransferase involved in cell wall biosynthesis
MRIAYLSIGRHLHTERWIRYFAQRGHECHLLTVQPGPMADVQVHDIRNGGLGKPHRYWRSLQRVRDVLARVRPDLLHTHFLTGYGYLGDWSRFHPNLLTVWGDDVYVTPHETRLKGLLARRALRSADALTGDSRDILECCVRLGADPARAFEVQWGVDLGVFRRDRSTGVRAELALPPEAPVLLSARSFTQPYYNLDIIIAAAARVVAARPDVRIIFAGYEGDQQPFIERARAAGLDGVARFVGRIPHERFADYLAASDVFITVPSVDATAVSLLEAMACGCSIVVSALPSALEWIRDGDNGAVVPPRDVDALVAALLQLVERPELRRRYGERCAQEAALRADHFVHMQRVEGLYRHLVEGAPLPDDLRSLAQQRSR